MISKDVKLIVAQNQVIKSQRSQGDHCPNFSALNCPRCGGVFVPSRQIQVDNSIKSIARECRIARVCAEPEFSA